ncbi:Biomphalysin 4 [Biomphalaria pfeifferi]|uniref:Biomphalysin 4 n=1 Tax=Biomphalaria pfeifferi TaxID=112525 RepID=A0AAD8F8W0_BIOPF|nr:Biomphalysin 4 [Biomphalaria pfeifferi]
MLYQVFVVVSLMSYVRSQCSYSNWSLSFDKTGQSMCDQINYYINALDRNNVDWDDDPISHLEGVECCQPTSPWNNVEQQVVYEDWTKTLDRDNEWAFCPVGYFLQGLYRSDTGWPRYKGYLFNLDSARCTKPANHPLNYGECSDIDITNCISEKGKCSCPGGYFLTGLYRADGDDLYFLKKIRCCSPAAKPLEMDEKSKIETRIMDTTLWNMANLAYYLGYGWCYGCRGVDVGEDFTRIGDSWEAAKTLFGGKSCEGDKSEERLNLVFGDWGYAVKKIIYGESVIEKLQPETIDSGVLNNRASKPVTESVQRSKTILETISHSTTSSFTNSHDLGISLNFDVFGIAKSGLSYTFRYTTSTQTTNGKSFSQTDGFSKSSSITLGPMEGAKYKVILSKSRTTVPYTAIVTTKFSTVMKGFLRWEDGDGNFHQIYRTSRDRPTFSYRFGDASVPFYAALKRQSDNNEGPWMWGMLFRKFPYARHVINRLTDEPQYQFTLTGKLEKVEGTHVDVEWEKIPLSRRDVSSDEAPVSNITTYIATSGPADKPASVEYPKVELKNNEPYEPIQIPVSNIKV